MTKLTEKTMFLLIALAALTTQGTANAGWFEDATGVRTPEPIRKIAPNGVIYTPPREQTSTFGVDPQQVATVFHVTNKAGGNGWFQLSYYHPRLGWQTFRQKKYAKNGASVSWKASVADVTDVRVIAFSPTTGKQALKWQLMRYRYKNSSHNDAAKSYTQHRYYTLAP